MFFDEIREMERARKARRAGTDDENVGFELFTLDSHSLADSSKSRPRPTQQNCSQGSTSLRVTARFCGLDSA